jgi:hypothetical protein
MLKRAKRLAPVFDKYCTEHSQPRFKLNSEEWRQVDYLLHITQPFYKWTTGLSKIRNVTIHNVFKVYNVLFDHFEKSIRQLQRKRVPWKQAMLHALHAGKEKLSIYYNKTEQVHGHLFAIGTILAPEHKLEFFSGKEWADNNYEWRHTYEESLRRYLINYQQQSISPPSVEGTSRQPASDFGALFNDDRPQLTEPQKASFESELTQYFNIGIFFPLFAKLL